MLLELHRLAHGGFKLGDKVDVFILELLILFFRLLSVAEVILQLVYGITLQREVSLQLLDLQLTSLLLLPKVKYLSVIFLFKFIQVDLGI